MRPTGMEAFRDHLLTLSNLGLYSSMAEAFVTASPTVLFLFFGRKAVMPSISMWQALLCEIIPFSSNLFV